MTRPGIKLELRKGGNKEPEGWFGSDDEMWAEVSDQDPPALKIVGPSSDGRREERTAHTNWPMFQNEATPWRSLSRPCPSPVVPAERWGHRGLVGRPIDSGGVQRPEDQRSTRGQGETRGLNNTSR